VSPTSERKRTLVVPPPAEEITPEIARRWLRERLGPYMEIAAAGALADDLDTREALHFLVLDVRAIADARGRRCGSSSRRATTIRRASTTRPGSCAPRWAPRP
jgi:hypothetical protein